MGYRYKLIKGDVRLFANGDASGQVEFTIRDDAGSGLFAVARKDFAPFVPAYPATKASREAEAVAAILAKYSGATPE